MASNMSLLSARNLGHRFDKGWLFRHQELDLLAGQRILVSGPNGSGKSTLVKTLAGLILPREGDIWHHQPFGYASLDLALYPELTCREHLRFSAQARGCDPQAEKLLDLVGLSESGDKPAAALSTGMRTRLKMAIALQSSPQVLLLDEVTAPLDEQGKEWVHQMVTEFAGGVIFASNDPHDRSIATHEIILD